MPIIKIKQKQLLQKVKKLGLDISQVLLFKHKKNSWEMIQGILDKKTTGLAYQKKFEMNGYDIT